MKKIFTILFVMILSLSANVQAQSPKVYYERANEVSYSKLKGYLFQDGILLRSTSLNFPEYSGGYFHHPNSSNLSKIYSFVKKGGRAWIYVSDDDISNNDLYQDIFGISISKEQITKKTKSATIKGEKLSTMWNDLRVAPISDKNLSISAFLMLADAGTWITTSTMSESSGKERVLSAFRRIGKGELIIMSGFGWSLINNDSIELMDNEEAILKRMFLWMAGKIEYSK